MANLNCKHCHGYGCEECSDCAQCGDYGWHCVDLDGSGDVLGDTTEYLPCSCNQDEHIPLYYTRSFYNRFRDDVYEETTFYKRQFEVSTEISEEEYRKQDDEAYLLTLNNQQQ